MDSSRTGYVMSWQDIALVLAGAIGVAVAVIHGVLVHRHMVKPLQRLDAEESGMRTQTRGLLGTLAQFTTYNWFLGGTALIIAAFWLSHELKVAIGFLVGSSYFYGAAGNLWYTRGRHPGWLLYAVAVLLIVISLTV